MTALSVPLLLLLIISPAAAVFLRRKLFPTEFFRRIITALLISGMITGGAPVSTGGPAVAIADSTVEPVDQSASATEPEPTLTVSADEADGPLPDLAVTDIDLSALSTDQESMLVSGTVTVTFANRGEIATDAPWELQILARDSLTGTETLLGAARIAAGIPAPGGTGTVEITAAGQLSFRDQPLFALADSGLEITESDEDNNLLASGEACRMPPVPDGGPYTYSVDLYLTDTDDDIEELLADGSADAHSSDLELIEDSGDQVVGLFFRHVPVPQGAVITEAYLQFTADETDSGPTVLSLERNSR